MPQPAGRSLPLSLPRKLVCDLLHFARQVPTVPVERHMNLAQVAHARSAAWPRPGWCALFTKAYGLVSSAHPELRRCYLAFPRPRLYEHPINVVSIAIERRFGGEDAVFFANLTSPESLTLAALEDHLRNLQTRPVNQVGSFRRNLSISALPLPLRRSSWWLALNLSGRKRAHFLGTFGISTYGALGASSLHPLSPLTTTLNYGVIGPNGTADVRLTYDHRVLDGTTIARALQELEDVLHDEIVKELRGMREANAA